MAKITLTIPTYMVCILPQLVAALKLSILSVRGQYGMRSQGKELDFVVATTDL